MGFARLLTYNYMDAPLGRHAQKVMRELGITYQEAVPQSIADLWQFWNCENVPDKLPKFLRKSSEEGAIACLERSCMEPHRIAAIKAYNPTPPSE